MKKTGFSLIELLVVATIIVVITAIGMVSYVKAGQTSRNGKRKADLESVRQALVLYRSDEGSYPNSSNYTNVANTLVSNGYLASPVPQDPKNSGDYVYEYSSNGTTFTLTAYTEPDADAYTVTNP
ncbi:MAG: prepilin-type N-terminal cleavage/methylation domain-containing protein [Candidatus Pacebacteria bacterium]|nr:prepilin-type N-terminal cleavage/methylation domain-containing protein [Candidatus Paceibacterota bacterium]